MGLALLALLTPALAQERVTVRAQNQGDFGRMIVAFPDRLDLPDYTLRTENGVLALEFDAEITVEMPDVPAVLGDYVTIGRADPTGRGIRFGLQAGPTVNHMEAGEQLFVDFLPAGWVGLPPPLPPAVITELTRRANDNAAAAERRRRAELAALHNPTAEVRVGRHPTFVRVGFHWSMDTEASWRLDGGRAMLDFGWPVPVDLYALRTGLPPEIEAAASAVTPDGNRVTLTLAEGVEPRYYAVSPREFVIDIDLVEPVPVGIGVAELEARIAEGEAAREAERAAQAAAAEASSRGVYVMPETTQTAIAPYTVAVGSTVRMVFPFEQDTPAAVFRRGDTVWMLFDTAVSVGAPEDLSALDGIARDFSVSASGAAQVVRMELSTERLATLGSEGRAWVLSLGDHLLSATEPVRLERRQDGQGRYEMAAEMVRPARVHAVHDPVVGDVLEVVTALPPARGVARDLPHVDFTALRSAHGLVIRPHHPEVTVRLDGTMAVVAAERGLTVSTVVDAVASDRLLEPEEREAFIDLAAMVVANPREFAAHRNDAMDRAADADEGVRATARLELSRLLLANELPVEALGVLRTMTGPATAPELQGEVAITLAAALVAAHRAEEAMAIFDAPARADAADALIWRTIARAETGDLAGARSDALAAEAVVEAYPAWVRHRFLVAAAQAAVEGGDTEATRRFLDRVDGAGLDRETVAAFDLLAGRLLEAEGRLDEALDTYGRVIAADFRPSRAEAVYRTIALLDRMERLDAERAVEVLAAEAMLWRGDALEADMLELLADLHLRAGAYRPALETVRDAALAHGGRAGIDALAEQAQIVFTDLYLNGGADALPPLDALTLYYDFRHLTPPGARGDEMIRNLARRLVRVDLLHQAAELLEYQVDNRLAGAARAQIAADLAVVHLANRRPAAALDALHRTRLAGLPDSVERQRRLLEARVLLEAGREELALDILSGLQGQDADLLRVEAHWRAGRYREAAEMLERLHIAGIGNLTGSGRMDVVRAAVGFALADDRIGLSRLRDRFSEALSASPEWAMFDYVTGRVEPQSAEFRRLAREIAGIDSLAAFLRSYREVYAPDGALTPQRAASET